MNDLAQYVPDWVVKYGPWVVTAASAAASALPYPTSEPWLTLRKVLDWLAFNFGKATNAAAPK